MGERILGPSSFSEPHRFVSLTSCSSSALPSLYNPIGLIYGKSSYSRFIQMFILGLHPFMIIIHLNLGCLTTSVLIFILLFFPFRASTSISFLTSYVHPVVTSRKRHEKNCSRIYAWEPFQFLLRHWGTGRQLRHLGIPSLQLFRHSRREATRTKLPGEMDFWLLRFIIVIKAYLCFQQRGGPMYPECEEIPRFTC